MSKLHIKKGDTVCVLAGKDKNKTGKVVRVLVDKQRAIVEGVNMVQKSQKPSAQNPQGGFVKTEAPIHISNVMGWCEEKQQPSQIQMKKLADGRRVRVWKLTGEVLD